MSAVVLQARAYAKLNLTVDVLGIRPDGYHEMRMIMQTVGLCDDIQIRLGVPGGGAVRSNLGFLPCDERNIALSAANLFFEETGIQHGGLGIQLHKRIPVCAGMAGGSSDAAAVLRALNGHYGLPFTPRELEELAGRLGSDVPYCLAGGTALAEGRGERITPLSPMPDCWFVVCKPGFSVSTPVVFKKLDLNSISARPDTEGALEALAEGNLPKLCRRMFNVFEEYVARDRHEIGDIKHRLIESGALGATMTGTGPTVFGVFDNAELARGSSTELKSDYVNTFLVKTNKF